MFVNKAGIESDGDKVYTKTVMDGLCEILSGLGIEMLHTNREKQVSEFMLDFVAWSRVGHQGIVLAAESEWAGWSRGAAYAEAVVTDYWKLLCVKSPLKLMIFASDSNACPPELILAKLQKAFECYRHHVPGEQYVFIDFAPSNARKAFYVKVPANVGDSVPFNKIPISLDLAKP